MGFYPFYYEKKPIEMHESVFLRIVGRIKIRQNRFYQGYALACFLWITFDPGLKSGAIDLIDATRLQHLQMATRLQLQMIN
jgi:hypothetical protein